MPFQLCRLWVGYWHSVGSLVQILNRIWTKCKIQTNFRLLWTRGLLKDEVWNSRIIMVWLLEEFGVVLEATWWHLGVMDFVSQYFSIQYYCTSLVLQYFDFPVKCPFSRTWVVLDASHRHLSPWTNGGGGAWNETQYKNENTSPDCKRLPFPFSFSVLDKFST